MTELERVRAICVGLPEVTERLSDGSHAEVAPKTLVEQARRAAGEPPP